MKISQIRNIIYSTPLIRYGLADTTLQEYLRKDVGGILTAKIAELRALVIAPRFAADIEARDCEIKHCHAVIAEWRNLRGDAP